MTIQPTDSKAHIADWQKEAIATSVDENGMLPSLGELFAAADAVGRKYQSRLEIEAYEQELFEATV